MPRRSPRPAPPSGPVVAVGYVRVSTDDQALGPDAQRAALESWARQSGAHLVAVHEDHVSGAAPLDKRPGLLAALAELEAHGATVLVAARRDRFVRGDVLAAALIERMAEQRGARLASADGVCEGDGPEAILMRRVVDAIAEYERALIRMRTRAALQVKRARGERTGECPFGYRVAADGRTLEPDAAEQAVIEAVVELRDAGLSFRAIAAELARRGAGGRTGQPLNHAQVARIVSRKAVAA